MKKRKFKVILLGVYFLIVGIYLSIPDGRLRIIFCDVDQGDGAIVERGKWQMLVDVGADNGKMIRCLDRYLPFWDKKIEAVMISHWDKDHSGALKNIAKSYKIENLFESLESEDKVESNINVYQLKAGDKIEYGDLFWEILSPGESGTSNNENSLVAVLNYNNRKFMFSGDADVNAEGKMMLWWRKKVDGLKVAHHGAETSSNIDWLRLINPGVAVISVGKSNNYGHPKQSVLDNLNLVGAKILRTDEREDIVLSWGENMYNMPWILGQLKTDGENFGKNILSYIEQMIIVIKKSAMY